MSKDWLKHYCWTRFSHNYRGFWEDYRWFIMVFILAVFCDGASTVYVMCRQGPEAEMHIVIRWLSRVLGPVAGPILGAVGKAVAGMVVAVYLRRFAVYIFLTASVLSLWAAWYNMWGYKVYTPVIFKWLGW